MDISKLGKGAIPNPLDIRDYRLEVAIKAIPLPEEYSIRDKVGKIKNQNGSSSCVAQAFAYYAEVLNYIETGQKIQLSARDIYSSVYQPEGGSYLRDAAKKICKSGVVLEEDAPSYENGIPPSEEFMRQRIDITQEEIEKGMTYLAKTFVTWNNSSFDWFKQAINTGKGAVVATWGNGYTWQNAILQTPDDPAQCTWAHGTFFTGWKKINGEEYLEFVNSWGETWGDCSFGYMPKSYIEKGLAFNPVTLIDLPNATYSTMQKMISTLKNLIDLYKLLIAKFKK